MPHFLIIFYLELFPATGVCVVGWAWLWPYHFKGACSGPATHGGPANLACVGRCACVSTHFLFVNEGQRS